MQGDIELAVARDTSCALDLWAPQIELSDALRKQLSRVEEFEQPGGTQLLGECCTLILSIRVLLLTSNHRIIHYVNFNLYVRVSQAHLVGTPAEPTRSESTSGVTVDKDDAVSVIRVRTSEGSIRLTLTDWQTALLQTLKKPKNN